MRFLQLSDRAWARFFCRVLLGLIFLMAGWFKCFQLTPWEHASRLFVVPYADTWIPAWMLWASGLAIPPLELVAGFLLVIGWRTRESLLAVGFILVLVTYGHLLKEALFSPIEHIFPRAVLMVAVFLIPDDALSIDSWLKGRSQDAP